MKRALGILTLLLTGGFFVFPNPAVADGMPPVVINELLWMGSSASSNDEWIELRNTTDAAIDLANWRLTKLSSNIEVPMLTISAGVIPPGGLFVVANDAAATSRLAAEPQLVDSSISLVNSKLQITLYDAAGILVDRADDGSGSPLAGAYQSGAVWKSMERNPNGIDGTQKESWHTASASVGFDDAEKEFGTPGSENSNQAPIISAAIPSDGTVDEAVNVDASETTDPEGDTVTIQWDFGDGATASGLTAEHLYTAVGSYTVTITANDGRAVSDFSSTIRILVAPASTPAAPPAPKRSDNTTPIGSAPKEDTSDDLETSKSIRLNELLPNPTGRDADGEFVELVNEGMTAINLRGWKITDRTRSFTIATDVSLASKHFLILKAAETKLSFKNSGKNEWFLVDPFGAIQHGVAYEGAPEGKSFSRTAKGSWRWTDPTPGSANVFVDADGDSPDNTDREVLPFISLEDVKRRALRTEVRVRGTVIVSPGTIGATFLYVSDGKTGIQVFSSKGVFSDLTPGDIVEIKGKIGEASGERKINIQTAEDILVVDSGDLPDPIPYVKTLPGGIFTTIRGTVLAKRGASLTLETPEGNVTVAFARGAQIDKSIFAIGDEVQIVGLWRITKDGGRLYPLNDEDIEPQGLVKAAATGGASHERSVDTTGAQTKTISLSASETKGTAARALLPPLVVMGGIGGYVWWRRRRGLAESVKQ